MDEFKRMQQLAGIQIIKEGILDEFVSDINDMDLSSGGSVEAGFAKIHLEDPKDIKIINKLLKTKYNDTLKVIKKDSAFDIYYITTK